MLCVVAALSATVLDTPPAAVTERLERLEAGMAALQAENRELRRSLDELRRQPAEQHTAPGATVTTAITPLGGSAAPARRLSEGVAQCCRWTPDGTCTDGDVSRVCTKLHEYLEAKALTVEFTDLDQCLGTADQSKWEFKYDGAAGNVTLLADGTPVAQVKTPFKVRHAANCSATPPTLSVQHDTDFASGTLTVAGENLLLRLGYVEYTGPGGVCCLNRDSIFDGTAASLDECLALCNAASTCISVEYTSSTGDCHVSSNCYAGFSNIFHAGASYCTDGTTLYVKTSADAFEKSLTIEYDKYPRSMCNGRNELRAIDDQPNLSLYNCSRFCTDTPECVSFEWVPQSDEENICYASSTCVPSLSEDIGGSYLQMLFVKRTAVAARAQDSVFGWQEIPLESGYEGHDTDRTPQYLVKDGFVYLRGMVKKTDGTDFGNEEDVGYLPAGARPSTFLYFAVPGFTTSGYLNRVMISGASGGVWVKNGDSGTVGLDGIVFPIEFDG